ncbi:MAG: AMP-binding protein [Candidatus Thermoplasmatota archaeon]|nr:AMP-binding protein [Candidatus Thermoplasmatota archaeon]
MWNPPPEALKPLPADRDWSGPSDQYGDPKTLYDMVRKSVDMWGADTLQCTYIPGEGLERVPITRGQFHDNIQALAAGMRAAGVKEDDRVLQIVDTSPQFAMIFYAANMLGAAASAVYTNMKMKETIHCYNLATPSILFIATGEILANFAAAKGDAAWPAGGAVLLDNEMPDEIPEGLEVRTWMEFIQAGRAAEPVNDPCMDPHKLASLIFTSGTSGFPKAVMLSNWNVLHNVLAIQGRAPLWPGRRTACFLPFAHSLAQAGDMSAMIYFGAEVHYVSDLLNLVNEVGEIRPHIMLCVPRVLNRFHSRIMAGIEEGSGIKKRLAKSALATARKRTLAAPTEMLAVPPKGLKDKILTKLAITKIRERLGGELDLMISGGAPLDPEIALFVNCLGITVLEGYGLSETAPLVSLNGWEDDYASMSGTVGRVIPGVEVLIDQDAWDDPDSEDGEILVRGPNVMLGYWENPEATKEVIMDDGHRTFRTGDLGRLVNGFLKITGRVKEQFKLQNGKYVAPSPLEEQLKLSPLIEQASVDGRGKVGTYVIIQPNEDAMMAALTAEGIQTSANFEETCAMENVNSWMLQKLSDEVMAPQNWKGFEKPKTIIIDHREWTTEDVLTPKMSVKRRVLEERFADRIAQIP